MRMIGIVIVVSYMIARLLYTEYLVSIWCYFAAIISVIVLMVILELRKDSRQMFSPVR